MMFLVLWDYCLILRNWAGFGVVICQLFKKLSRFSSHYKIYSFFGDIVFYFIKLNSTFFIESPFLVHL